ncbi:hypothetical protein E4T56_gene542 [Termitomyces sp. T112]|nr:hypothetical protein E4T56_gene542 [Termitomyces sp. T112]
MEVEYLRVIITPNGMHMDPAKVDAILNWPPPQNIKEDTPWDWDSKCQSIFLLLKKASTSALVPCHFDPSLPIVLKCNASNYAIARILSQLDSRGKDLRPIAFYTCSMIPMELNYNIYNKELLAIIKAFHQWWAYLKGSPHHIQVYSDHNNLQYFTTTKQLSCCQAQWSETLLEVSPFYANKSYNPWLMLSLKDIPSYVAHKVAEDLQSLHQSLQDKICTANQAYSKHTDT